MHRTNPIPFCFQWHFLFASVFHHSAEQWHKNSERKMRFFVCRNDDRRETPASSQWMSKMQSRAKSRTMRPRINQNNAQNRPNRGEWKTKTMRSTQTSCFDLNVESFIHSGDSPSSYSASFVDFWLSIRNNGRNKGGGHSPAPEISFREENRKENFSVGDQRRSGGRRC